MNIFDVKSMVLPKSVVKPKFDRYQTLGHVMPVHEYYSLFEVVSLIFDELSSTSNQTDLSTTHNSSNVIINSSNGTDATINAATVSTAGVMSSTDYIINRNNSDVIGMGGNATLGSFSGNIITDNTTIKNALQQLEIAIGSGNGTTDLSTVYTTSTVTINSSTGTDATITQAIASDNSGIGGTAGIIRAVDRKKLDNSISNIIWDTGINVTESVTNTDTKRDIRYVSESGDFGLLGAVGVNNAGSNNMGLLPKNVIQSRLGIHNISLLTGVGENSSQLGTFSGNIIPDNSSIKTALQALESSIINTSPFLIATINISGGHTGKAIVKYSGSLPTIEKVSSSVWTITTLANSEIFSLDIYSPVADNPGANLTLNINSSSTIYNQDITTLRIPSITGVNIATIPGNYGPTTGAVNLLPRVNTVPSNGDVQIVLNNFNNANALGTGATLLKLVF